MAAPSESTNVACTQKTSKQLLYSEKFEGTLEEKLKVIGKTTGKESVPRKTFRPPPSSVLSKVQAFLPQLASANEQLMSLPPEEVDIENVNPEHDGPLIEMNFALMPQLDSDDESTDDNDEGEESDDGDTDSNDETATSVNCDHPSQNHRMARNKICVVDKDSEESAQRKDTVKNQGCREG